MSAADILINVVIWLMQNTLLRVLPTSISAMSIQDVQNSIFNFKTAIFSGYNFTSHFMNMKLLFSLLGAIIIAEVALHFGWKGMKWIINVVRGSGG